jgi:hypothetical protein
MSCNVISFPRGIERSADRRMTARRAVGRAPRYGSAHQPPDRSEPACDVETRISDTGGFFARLDLETRTVQVWDRAYGARRTPKDILTNRVGLAMKPEAGSTQ